MVTGALESLASTSISNLGIFQKKLPLLNESIASAVNFQQFRQFLQPDGPGSQRFGNFDITVPEQRPVAEFAEDDPQLNRLGCRQRQSDHLFAVIRQDDFNIRAAVAEPGLGVNLNVSSTLNFSCDVAVHLQFGVDGSTGNFFIVANGQPAVTLTPTLTATLNGSASLGFLSINITNGTVSGSGTGSVTLNDPQTDSPATPGIITSNELASSNFSAGTC